MITITVERDYSCRMARVNDGVGNGMEGNTWDFHNGCHGLYHLQNFVGVDDLAYVLERLHKRNGEVVSIIRSEYKYN